MKHLRSGSRGFSLVELMVAMLIGLVIVLGAGQLFLNGFLNFQKIEELSDKQAALTFAADVLLSDVRRSESPPDVSPDGDELTVVVNGESKRYYLDELDGGWSIYVQVDSDSPQPIVGGFQGSGAFSVSEIETGLIEMSFDLVGEDEDIVFHAMNRTAAVAGS